MSGTTALRTIIVIPARYGSTRYPGKPLVMIRGATGIERSLIERSWRAAKSVPGIDAVYIATDDMRIAEAAARFGAEVVMTSSDCANGTERCAEALSQLGDPDIIINLQGDAPLTPPAIVSALITRMLASDQPQVATPAVRCTSTIYSHLMHDQAAGRVGGTTVVFDSMNEALYFSKRVIPFMPSAIATENNAAIPVYLHMGVYAYRPAALALYKSTPVCRLEQLEGLEQLRFLDTGIKVAVVVSEPPKWDTLELNNPTDLAQMEAVLSEHHIE